MAQQPFNFRTRTAGTYCPVRLTSDKVRSGNAEIEFRSNGSVVLHCPPHYENTVVSRGVQPLPSGRLSLLPVQFANINGVQLDIYPEAYAEPAFIYVFDGESWFHVEREFNSVARSKLRAIAGRVDDLTDEADSGESPDAWLPNNPFPIEDYLYRLLVSPAQVIRIANDTAENFVVVEQLHGPRISMRSLTPVPFTLGAHVTCIGITSFDKEKGHTAAMFQGNKVVYGTDEIRRWIDFSRQYWLQYRFNEFAIKEHTFKPWERRNLVENAFRYWYEVSYATARLIGDGTETTYRDYARANAIDLVKLTLDKLYLFPKQDWCWPRCA